ncbi:MAG: DPP IV N-terminal domain-containing protein, partial [Gemmatimonadetes bacterium]|nr:DPP IV N-terminal domain-containing protein [Gemmatimonadota bacterium]
MRRLLTLAGLLLAARPSLAQVDYRRAEQFLTWNTLRHTYHDQVAPNWYPDSTRFWYRVHTRRGYEFMTVNPATGTKGLLFDNARLAAALSVAADTAVDPGKLPFQTFAFDRDGKDERAIRLRIGKRGFRCELAGYRCATADTLPNLMRFVRSPDERWDAFVSGFDLWIRAVGSTDSTRLTTDGADGYRYGEGAPRATQLRLRMPSRPQIVWSPDSKRLAVARIDERKVGTIDLISMTPTRPVHYRFPYALPGDSIVETVEWYLAEVETKAVRRIDAPPQPSMAMYNFGGGAVQWSPTGDRVYLTHVNRGPKRVRLLAADPATGATRELLADSSASYVIGSIELIGGGVNWKPLRNGDVIWFAERDGFGHLYRHGPDGKVKNQITTGPWIVAALVGVDETLG